MSAKYEYIICTYACPLAFVSATGEITCIHYLPLEGETVIAKPQNYRLADHGGSLGVGDLFPILAWQPWYGAPAASNGIVCLSPWGFAPGEPQ